MDFATQFMQGFEEERKLKKSEEVRKTKAKALQSVLQSISTLMEPQEQSSTSFPDIPAPSPGGMPPVTLGSPPGAPPSVGGAPGGYGAPPAPAAPSFFAPPPAAPVTTTNTVTPDRQEVLRGALKALGGAEYAPETASSIHALMPDFFKPSQTKVVGGKLVDESGKVVAEGMDKPSYGVSEAGWLTTVHPDGTVQEHVGTKPMQTTVQDMRGKTAENVQSMRGKTAEAVAGTRKLQGDAANDAKIRAAEIVAQGGIDRVAAAGKYAKDLAKFKIDAKDKQDPKTVAAYYVKLLQGYNAGDSTEEDITMMEYIRPIVEKQGLLPMLMQGGGQMPAAAEAPWKKGEEPPAAAPIVKEKGWYDKLFGGKPAADADPVPEQIRKGTAPALPAKKGAGTPKVSGGGGFSIDGTKVLAPEGHTDADIKMVMGSMQKKMKEGHSKAKLLGILKDQGWSVQ